MCNGIASRVKSVVRGRIKEIGTWESRIKEKREREREREREWAGKGDCIRGKLPLIDLV